MSSLSSWDWVQKPSLAPFESMSCARRAISLAILRTQACERMLPASAESAVIGAGVYVDAAFSAG